MNSLFSFRADDCGETCRTVAIAIVIFLAGINISYALDHEDHEQLAESDSINASLVTVPAKPVVFELVSGHGDVVTEKSIAGKTALLTFGFTHCHHICPMTASKMGRALAGLDNAVGIFVSVDPERDSPDIVASYAERFGDSMIGLGGNYHQINAVIKAVGANYSVTKSERTYSVQHTPSIYLISRDGIIVKTFALTVDVDALRDAVISTQ